MYFIKEGNVAVHKKGVGVVVELGPGAYIGEVALLGLNPHRSLLEIMQYFKLKAPTRRYFQAKVFHTAMFLAEAQDAYAPGVVNIGERKKDAARALGNMRQAARGGAPIQCRQHPIKPPKKKSTPRTRTRVRFQKNPRNRHIL